MVEPISFPHESLALVHPDDYRKVQAESARWEAAAIRWQQAATDRVGEADALHAEVAALKAKLAEQEELAMWALSGGRVWLGSTIARGTGERVAIEVTSPYGGCEVIAGTHHVDRWECLRLARQIITARAEALAATKEV